MSAIILVVDDDETVRVVTRRVLERLGYTVLVAEDGAQALSICDAFGAAPDLIVSDVVMPGMNGGELVLELARGGRAPRMLLMSGQSEHEARETIGDAVPFLRKPFGVEELEAKVREVLNP